MRNLFTHLSDPMQIACKNYHFQGLQALILLGASLVPRGASGCLLGQRKNLFLATREEISSCVTRRHLFLCHKETSLLAHKKKIFLLVTQDEMSSCDTRRMSFCDARRDFFLCHEQTLILVIQEEISSCVTGRHIFLCHKKTFFL